MMSAGARKTLPAVSLLAFALTTAALPCLAREKTRIVVIKSGNLPAYANSLVGVRAYLYSQGVDFDITEYDVGAKNREEAQEDIKESRLHHPVFYLALGTLAAKLVQDRVTDVPVVFGLVPDPSGNGISVPGVSLNIDPAMELRRLKEILPRVKSVGIVFSEKTSAVREKIAEACARESIRLVERKIVSVKEFPDAFREIVGEIDCFLMIADPAIYFPSAVEFLLRESLAEKVPVVGLTSVYTRAGALVSFECDYRDQGAQIAEMALGICRGTLPPETAAMPRKINFSLNLTVAQKLGIAFPKEVLRDAHEVFGQ